MELMEMMLHRRSVRQYTDEAIPEEKLQNIIKAGLASESAKNVKPWELIVVQERETLDAMVNARAAGAAMLAGAKAAIVVIADTTKLDVWTEDCSIVMANMHLMADAQGLGSCWIQGRCRQAADGRSTSEYLKDLLGIPAEYEVEAMLSLGVTEKHPAPYTEADLKMEKVHYGKF